MSAFTLVLSPASYPWDIAVEQTFLDPEIPVLLEEFERIILVPQQIGGARARLPAGVEVEESFAREQASLSRTETVARSLLTGLIPRETARRPRWLASRVAAKGLVAHAGLAHHATHWLADFVRVRRIDPTRCAVVTFWWGAPTTGFALAKRRLRGLRVFTRAHGADLYEDRHNPAYIPCRHSSLALLDGVFPDSEKGREYLRGRYPGFSSKFETARLGLHDPGASCGASTDGVLRVVTCSLLRPIKRLDLLVGGLAVAGAREPTRRIEWTHFGTGPLREELENLARTRFPQNVSVAFRGYTTQSDLLAWYGANPVDVFVNVSSSEGTPVSIIEAVACGIPILATAVGGNPEIATSRNGLLLNANPTPDEIASALDNFAGGPRAAEWRAGSRAVWDDHYNALKNYRAFAHAITRARPATERT